MAQKRRSGPQRHKSSTPPPLERAALEALALGYVGRFATSRAKLIAYLDRKLRERGWAADDGSAPPTEAIADRLVALRYVDDEAYAAMKTDAMQRRGLGTRRIAQALRHDGIAEDISDGMAPDPVAHWEAAARFARRKRIGPFATTPAERPLREKQFAAFLRAGHDMETARQWVNAAPNEAPPRPDDEDHHA
ncbi:MAG TPA: RecX family transcriptional regulator [Sphingobium sp.]|nr:RecX family transcriptional regulator [Sphingobium sp.]